MDTNKMEGIETDLEGVQPPPTGPPSGTSLLKHIDPVSISKICSGQVIVDLATAVKELIENALDAKATNIEVRLREMGVEAIEVSDNGSGIDEENYEGICLKHFTSKIQQFSDIYESLVSFGFRGEALNALCEISQQVTITTRQAKQPMGYSLKFNKDGRLDLIAVGCLDSG
jgi:DNA mismatch repair protein PMS2